MKFFLFTTVTLFVYSMGLLVSTVPHFSNNPYDEKRLLQLIIITITLIGHSFLNFHYVTNSFYKFLLILLVIFAAVSILSAEAINYAFIEFVIFIALFYFAITISSLYEYKYKESIITYYTYICLYAVFLYFIVFVSSYIAAFTTEIGYNWQELFFGFVNRRFFNQYQIFILPFLTLLIIQSKVIWLRRLTFLVAVIFWSLLFLSNGRGILLSILFTSIVLFIFYRQLIINYLKHHILLATSGFCINLVLFHLLPSLITNSAYSIENDRALLNIESPQRLIFWQQASDSILANPWFGIGPMHFALETMNHPHNIILQWAGEWGVLSLFTLLILTLSGLFHWFKFFNKNIVNYKNPEVVNSWLTLSFQLFLV